MRFGPVPLQRPKGAILAHSVQVPGGRLRKGRVLTEGCRHAGRGGSGGGHGRAAGPRRRGGERRRRPAGPRAGARSGQAGLRVEEAFTGRVNIRADRPGIVALDEAAINALNRVDPMITLATVAPWQRAWPGMMVGTVKIISYGVADDALRGAEEAARGALSVRPVALGRPG